MISQVHGVFSRGDRKGLKAVVCAQEWRRCSIDIGAPEVIICLRHDQERGLLRGIINFGAVRRKPAEQDPSFGAIGVRDRTASFRRKVNDFTRVKIGRDESFQRFAIRNEDRFLAQSSERKEAGTRLPIEIGARRGDLANAQKIV